MRAKLFPAVMIAVAITACDDAGRPVGPGHLSPGDARFTAGSGTQSTLAGRSTFAEPFRVKRKSGEWEIEAEAPNAVDVAVQTITFQPGSQSGWHRHPGPVFIQVVSGTMTFYESDDPTCSPVVRSAGQGYLDTGEHAHIARNESGAPAQNVVTYFAPPGAALRIDAAAPGNCPF